MASLLVRALLIFIILTVLMRIMGKRQVGEMELSELVTTLLLSELAAIPIDDPDIPLMHAVAPILLIFSLEVIITFCKTKCNFLKKIFETKPVFLIERGKLNQKELVKNRISINELLGEFRIQGIADIFDIYYAILEQDGKLSILQRAQDGKREKGMPHALITDGEINICAAESLGMTRNDVLQLCHAEGKEADDIFLLQKDDAGNIRCIAKE